MKRYTLICAMLGLVLACLIAGCSPGPKSYGSITVRINLPQRSALAREIATNATDIDFWITKSDVTVYHRVHLPDDWSVPVVETIGNIPTGSDYTVKALAGDGWTPNHVYTAAQQTGIAVNTGQATSVNLVLTRLTFSLIQGATPAVATPGDLVSVKGSLTLPIDVESGQFLSLVCVFRDQDLGHAANEGTDYWFLPDVAPSDFVAGVSQDLVYSKTLPTPAVLPATYDMTWANVVFIFDEPGIPVVQHKYKFLGGQDWIGAPTDYPAYLTPITSVQIRESGGLDIGVN